MDNTPLYRSHRSPSALHSHALRSTGHGSLPATPVVGHFVILAARKTGRSPRSKLRCCSERADFKYASNRLDILMIGQGSSYFDIEEIDYLTCERGTVFE